MTPNPLERAPWPALRELGSEWQAVMAEAREFRATPAEAAQARRQPDSWSAAECYAHLNLSLTAVLPRLEQALSVAGPASREPKLDLWGRLLCWALDPKRKLRSKTGTEFAPSATRPWPAPVEEFLALHESLGALLARSATLDMDGKVRSPFGPMSYSAYSMCRVVLTHDRRHQAQARRAAAGTPA